MSVGEMTIEDAAKEAAGNWQRFESFFWFRDRDILDPENWSIFYTSNRDSCSLVLSNAQTIIDAMTPFSLGDDPDVVFESHSHWLVGHLDGFSIRVIRDGGITNAFRSYHELTERNADNSTL
jgi:hypothetical protein